MVPSISSRVSTSGAFTVSSPLSLSSILGEFCVGSLVPNDALITAGRLLPL